MNTTSYALARRQSFERLLRAAIGAACLMTATGALAQSWPAKPIRIIVPSGVGSVGDAVARLLGSHMSSSLGQPVVIENVTGAGGLTGTTQVVRAPKDGYTVGVISNNTAINPVIYKTMPFDTATEIGPIGRIGETPLVLVSNAALPAKDLRELIALAKSKPGSMNYGSGGNGSVPHLAGVMLTGEAGVNIVHVPYKETGRVLADVVGGQTQMAFVGIGSAVSLIQAGTVRAMGVTALRRSSSLPQVPTMSEAGLPNFHISGWMALAGPAGVPKAIVDRLNLELNSALASPEVRERLQKLGVEIQSSSPGEAHEFFLKELDKYGPLVRRSGAIGG